MILHDDSIEVDATKMNNLIEASGCKVEPYWPMLFSKMVNNVGVGKLLEMSSSGGGGPVAGVRGVGGEAGAGGAGGATEEKKAEKVEEEEEEDVDFDLFG